MAGCAIARIRPGSTFEGTPWRPGNIVYGQGDDGTDNAVIVELKQWTEVAATLQDGIVVQIVEQYLP